MAAIQNINNNIIGTITTRPNAENVQSVIEFNDKLIKLYTEKKDKLENLINSNEKYIELTKENINLRKDYIQTVKESKELGEKRIVLLQESKQIDREIINIHERTISKLQALLDRNSSKIDASDVKLLDKQLDTFTKKENVLKAQANVVDTKIEKLAVKIEFAEKQITKIEASGKNIETSNVQVKPDKNSFVTGYRPTADQIAKLELSKIQLETHNLDSSASLFQQRVYYSQKNIYESILNSLLLKVVV